ncbi:MAG TPA: hypothetical protein VFR15_14290 [Chloroflexia bacterium]|nr:hypothetical protein [Chloroflexia bacterium]
MSENDETPRETSISKSRSPEQIGDYWDTHSVADVWDQTHDVEFEVRVPRDRSLRVYGPHSVNREDADVFVLEVIEEDPVDETDEERWDKAFADSADKLAELADQALAEHREGKTQPLDPDKL